MPPLLLRPAGVSTSTVEIMAALESNDFLFLEISELAMPLKWPGWARGSPYLNASTATNTNLQNRKVNRYECDTIHYRHFLLWADLHFSLCLVLKPYLISCVALLVQTFIVFHCESYRHHKHGSEVLHSASCHYGYVSPSDERWNTENKMHSPKFRGYR